MAHQSVHTQLTCRHESAMRSVVSAAVIQKLADGLLKQSMSGDIDVGMETEE